MKFTNRNDEIHKKVIFKQFSYSTSLPSIKHKKAKTEFKKGILKITAPKK
ncbi:Hsp20/alpha crystallin family protein [Candidatus Pacearchaeota archaeon]|nr:Hsp20/alpha crystallin family protein [Candidatus Pacearchaeota archaeon]